MNELPIQFRTVIQAALERGALLEELRAILCEYRDTGLSQQEAYATLNALRLGAGAQLDDRILEVMDVVVGFCAPHYRVWAGHMKT